MQFLAVTCSIAAVLIGVTMLRLRAICTHESARPVRRSRSPARGFNIWRVFTSAIPWLTPSLDGNPVVWREWQRSRPSRWMMLVVVAYGGLSLLFTSLAMLWTGGQVGAIVNGFQVAVGLLLLSVTAATSLAEERARGSLDLLLSTPLSTRQIVVGKWLGAFRVVPMLAILPALLISAEIYVADTQELVAGRDDGRFCALCGRGGYQSWPGDGHAIFASGPGHRNDRDGVRAGHGRVGPFAALMYGPPSQRLILASPMFWALMSTMGAAQTRMRSLFGGAFFWIIFYALCAAALLLTTLTSFDRRLGRIDDAASLVVSSVSAGAHLHGSLRRLVALFCALSVLAVTRPDFRVVRECVALCSGIACAGGQGIVAACGRSFGWSDRDSVGCAPISRAASVCQVGIGRSHGAGDAHPSAHDRVQ